jgi:hypothetical protein
MMIKLTADVSVDGLLFGEGSALDLSPDFAEALIFRGKAVEIKRQREAMETAVLPETETAEARPKARRKRVT